MKSITLSVPEEVNEREVKMAVAALLFDKGILSPTQQLFNILVVVVSHDGNEVL